MVIKTWKFASYYSSHFIEDAIKYNGGLGAEDSHGNLIGRVDGPLENDMHQIQYHGENDFDASTKVLLFIKSKIGMVTTLNCHYNYSCRRNN